MLLCHTGLALSSSVAGFGVSLPSVSFLLRSSLVVFIFSLFVVSGLLAGSLCVLLRIRACTCAVSFMLNFVSCLLDSNFIFSFCGCPFFSSSSGMVTTTQGMFSLLPIGRHLCSFAHIRIRATLLRIAASAKLSHVILRALPRFRYFPHAIPGLFGRIIHPHHNGGASPPALTLNSLIHLLLSSLCSQSATCSFLFRVFLLLAVVN